MILYFENSETSLFIALVTWQLCAVGNGSYLNRWQRFCPNRLEQFHPPPGWGDAGGGACTGIVSPQTRAKTPSTLRAHP